MNDYLRESKRWWSITHELMEIYNDGSHTGINRDGSLIWKKDVCYHREDDKPARIWKFGKVFCWWYKDGQLHRDDNKPAVLLPNEIMQWYKEGKLHRVNGPALMYPNGNSDYYFKGQNITVEVQEWLQIRQYEIPFTLEESVEFQLKFG
jgi:hypothetical protein